MLSQNIYRLLVTLLFVLAFIGILFIFQPQSSAQTGPPSGQELWQNIAESSIVSTNVRAIVPKAYRTVRLNKTALEQVLGQAPLEFTAAARTSQVVLNVPLPDGTLSRFRIENSPIMEPALAARFPNIQTYRGQGIDDPTATARFDMTPAGFHAIILSAKDTIYVDPYAKGDTTNYISYFKRDLTNAPNYECKLDDFNPAAGTSPLAGEGALAAASTAGTLRTYRLALAVTGEYTLYFAPDLLEPDAVRKQKALVGLTTTLNRVNGIYEREVSVRMVLVADQMNIIYTNPATDPYQSDMVLGASMLVENQANLDAPKPAGPIGEGNYDIGHVMSTGFGGVAFLESVCDRGNPTVPGDGFNAGGFTGLDTPEGDGFDVDFVAHEMGHQFGGNHTFNGSDGSCGGNEGADSAFEPGSGTTIQAYAGICGTQDLQPHSDDYFHVKSLEEISAFITGGGNVCATQSAVNNAAPSVNAGPNYNIPKNTPFTLTATGSDPDNDPLTYNWEEYDLGPSAPGGGNGDNDNDGQARPIFRSYNATLAPARTFPSLQYILNNANVPPAQYDCGRGAADPCITGEDLPSITRTMKFKVTARDNRSVGGGYAIDEAQLNVSGGAGPFVVTAPNTGVTLAGASTQTVTWDVASTTAAPINAVNVRISLSLDGGNTFPIVFTESTPNDGSETVTLPDINTASARVKVEAVGNIFFDISNANFTITRSGPACAMNFALSSLGSLASGSTTYINPGYPASSVIDGERKGLNWGNGGGWNDNTRDVWPDFLDVTMNGTQTISEIRVYTVQNDFRNPVEPTPETPANLYGIRDFEVQSCVGNVCTTVPGGTITNNDKAMRVITLTTPIATSKLRIVVNAGRSNWSRITEVEAIGCP